MGLYKLIRAKEVWLSRPGIRFGEILSRMTEQLQHSAPPVLFVIYCRGNSISLTQFLSLLYWYPTYC